MLPLLSEETSHSRWRQFQIYGRTAAMPARALTTHHSPFGVPLVKAPILRLISVISLVTGRTTISENDLLCSFTRMQSARSV